MNPMASLNFVALSLFLLLVVGESHQGKVSMRGFTAPKQAVGAETSTEGGLCATMVTGSGYKCQEHQVTTKDGYILSLQRIPEGRNETKRNRTKKETVIIQHGIMVDGMSWLMNTPEQNLPMILADLGYDVWISNARGTRFSRGHTSLDTSSEDYWRWSWDEMVTYELPAIFDYVSKETGQKMHYVGHSLGTLVPLAAFSEGRLVNQLKSATLLSPIAYLSHMTTAIGAIAARSIGAEAFKIFGIAEFDPKGVPALGFIRGICEKSGIDCKDLFTAFSGDNCCLNSAIVDKFLSYEPQPTSTMNLIHLSQTVRTGILSKYDFERPSKNIKQYAKLSPPAYNLSNIPHNLPIFMSYGGQDALSDVADVKNLLEQLKFHDKDKLVVQYIKEYAHCDFIMADNAKEMVFDAVIAFIQQHSQP